MTPRKPLDTRTHSPFRHMSPYFHTLVGGIFRQGEVSDQNLVMLVNRIVMETKPEGHLEIFKLRTAVHQTLGRP